MMNDITVKPAQPAIQGLTAPRPVERNTTGDQESFGQWLNKSIETVNKLQDEGDSAAMKLLTGRSTDIHGTMIAMQKATISMNLMMEVRNKIINAYEEVKRMQF